MTISMYRASVPLYVRGLKVLSGLLDKAEAYATEKGVDPSTLVNARLADDMFPLSGQVQRSSDTSKMSIERLSGVVAPKFEDNETTLEQLKARLANTVAYVESVGQDHFHGAESREIKLNFGEFQPTFTGESYLFDFALPNFYFHLTAAYAILRNQGVPVGKRDFLGPYEGV